MDLLSGSSPGSGGHGNRTVDPALAAGQHSIVSHVALQYNPERELVYISTYF